MISQKFIYKFFAANEHSKIILYILRRFKAQKTGAEAMSASNMGKNFTK